MHKKKSTRNVDYKMVAAYISTEQYTQLKSLSQKSGMSMSAIMSECIKASIDKVTRVLDQLPSLNLDE